MTVRRRQRGRKGAGSVEQLPSGRWRLKVTVEDGSKRTYGVFETEDDAFRAQHRWCQTRLLPGDDPDLLLSSGVGAATVTAMAAEDVRLDDWFQRWQEAKRRRSHVVDAPTGKRRSVVRKSTKRGGSATTRERDNAYWRHWWSPRVGALLPANLTEEKVDEVAQALEKAVAANTVRTHIGVVKAFLNWLVDERMLDANPIANWATDVDPAADRVREIVVPDFRFLDLLSEALDDPTPRASIRNTSGHVGVSFQRATGKWQAFHRKKYLGLYESREEARAAVAESRRAEGGCDRLILELLLQTGGRRSEVAGLRWRDVDLTAKRISIVEPIVTVNGKLERKATTKSGKSRSIVIGPHLADLIQAERRRRRFPGPCEPLVVSPAGGPVDFTNWIRDRLRPAIDQALQVWEPVEVKRLMAQEGMSLEEAEDRVSNVANKLRKLTPHHLRHTAAALMWAAGATDLEVQMTLGHRDLKTSRNLYGHLLEGAAEKTASRIDEMRLQMRQLRDAS